MILKIKKNPERSEPNTLSKKRIIFIERKNLLEKLAERVPENLNGASGFFPIY